jgi:hypothetical protein
VVFLKIKTQTFTLALVVLICAFALSGCAADGRNTRMPNGMGTRQNQNLPGNNLQGLNTPNGISPNTVAPQGFDTQNPGNDTRARLQGMQNQLGLQNPQGGDQQNVSDRKRADTITTQLANIRELEQVSVVVDGNTALVGCTTSGAQAGAADSVTTIRSMVEEKVRQADPSISKVVVTSQPNFVNEISRLARDRANGTANGTTAGTLTGAADRTANRIANGITNGTANGTTNGTTNRMTNETANDFRARFNNIIQSIENQRQF